MRSPARSSLLALVLPLVACTSKVGDTLTDGQPLDSDSAVPCDVSTVTEPSSYAQVADVVVQRDASNIPHIYGQNDGDVFFAQGYLEGRDRLMQIDTTRRAATGRLAEVWGEGSLVSDEQARAIGFERWACPAVVALAEARPSDYALIVAFVSGFNKRVAEVQADPDLRPYGMGAGELDYTPDPLTVLDVLSIGRRITWGFSSSPEPDILYTLFKTLIPNYTDVPTFRPVDDTFTVQDEALPAGPTTPPAATTTATVTDPEALRAFLAQAHALRTVHGDVAGSNNWLVNGARTDNGKPILANDPHAGLDDPSALYLVHMDSKSAGGSFDVAGWGFAGVPGVQLGHNRDVVWGATVNFADVVDLWDVDVNGTMTEADIGGVQTPIIERHEAIGVKQADGSVVDTDYVVYEIEGRGIFLGPELLSIPDELLGDGATLMNWTGFSGGLEFYQYLDLDRAADLDDFVAAVDYGEVGIHNWIGASADGIRYHVHGLVPDRGGPGRPEAFAVMDASDPATLWTGDMLGPERFPDLDGSQDYIVTANNDPWGQTRDNDPNNDEFYYGAFYAPGFRASRIDHELARYVAEGPVTVSQMQALQVDIHSNIAEHLLPFLVDAAAHIEDDESLAEFRGDSSLTDAVARLSAWDQRATRDSEEQALFRAFQSLAAKQVLEDDLSILFDAVEDVNPVTMDKFTYLSLVEDNSTITEGAARHDLLVALRDALAFVDGRKAELGTDTYAWSSLHNVHFGADYGDGVYFPVDGENSSVNVSECSMLDEGELATSCNNGSGSVFRQVTSFDDAGTPVMTFNWPYGHVDDATAWTEGTYETLLFDRADVDASTVSTETLAP